MTSSETTALNNKLRRDYDDLNNAMTALLDKIAVNDKDETQQINTTKDENRQLKTKKDMLTAENAQLKIENDDLRVSHVGSLHSYSSWP